MYIKETELQELQMKFETLKMENNGKEKTTSDDYWRLQYLLNKQMQKTDDSNLKQTNKAFSQKHLKVMSDNQKLGSENKKLVAKIKELTHELEKNKKKRLKQKRLFERLTAQQESPKNSDTETQEIHKVITPEDEEQIQTYIDRNYFIECMNELIKKFLGQEQIPNDD